MSKKFEFESQSDGVHSPESFGFDMNNERDAKQWSLITGENPVIIDDKESNDSSNTNQTDSFDREMTYWESQGF